MKERTEGEAKASLMPCYSGIHIFIVLTLGLRSEFRQTNSPSPDYAFTWMLYNRFDTPVSVLLLFAARPKSTALAAHRVQSQG